MEFKVGDMVFYDWIGYAESVEIVKCYPKSDRYRIQSQSKSTFEVNANVSEVFKTENDLWQSKIDRIDGKIKVLEEQRDGYKSNIVENRT